MLIVPNHSVISCLPINWMFFATAVFIIHFITQTRLVLFCISNILSNFYLTHFAVSRSWFFTFISKCLNLNTQIWQVKHKIFKIFFLAHFHGDISQYNFTQGFVLSNIFTISYTLLYMTKIKINLRGVITPPNLVHFSDEPGYFFFTN